MKSAVRVGCLALLLSFGFWGWAPLGFAQSGFFEGKTIRIVVGFSAGGGYDVYSRTLARHMGKHIPGQPSISVENMTGAGSMIAANHVFKAANPDGLTIGHFIGGLFLQQLLGKPGIEFDGLKFEFIGVPAQDNFVFNVAKNAGVKDLKDWMTSKKVIKFGGVGSGSGTDDLPNILKATLGLPLQVVSGYKGTSVIRLAFNSGEVQAVSNSWESTKATWRKELDGGELIVILQANIKSHPELAKVPVAIDYAKTEEAKKLIQTVVRVHGPSVRPYVLPPKTPKDRVEILRKAFMATMKDPEFLAEANKAKLDIDPLSGSELERNVRGIYQLEPELVAKLKDILK